MRRITLPIFISSLTFLIGVGSARVFLPTPAPLTPPLLRICDLSIDIARHDGKIVRVRGELSVGPLGAISLKGEGECGEDWAGVYFRENLKLIGEMMESDAAKAYKGGFAKANVVISGRFGDRKSSCPNDYVVIEDAVLESASLKD